MSSTLGFGECGLDHLSEVGGKNASLGEMITQLSPLGIQIPQGFATTANAYRLFLDENHLCEKIYPMLTSLDVDDMAQLQIVSAQVRDMILQATLSKPFKDDIIQAYRQMKLTSEQSVAVRSSATAEDLPEASFAGQQETFLNICGEENLLAAVKQVFASLYTERAIAYRVHHKFKHEDVAISAGIQQMVRSDIGASGVMFTLDTESGFNDVVFITAAFGLGETIVQGVVNPDEFYVHKPTLHDNKQSILSRKVGTKLVKMIYADLGERVKTVDVSKEDQQRLCLNDDEVLSLARQAVIIEKHYGKAMDIEWAKDGVTG
jgi:pyruvate,water dikinase